MGETGRENAEHKRLVYPGRGRGGVIALCLMAFLLSSAGCTMMLAGMVVEAIVTEVKSRKKNPGKNEIVYEILARDTEENVSYLVEIHIQTQRFKREGVMVQYVDTLHIAYVNRLEQEVTITDLDGDGIVDRIRVMQQTFFPPVSCTSTTYPPLRASQSALGGTGPASAPEPESPWYGFSERESLEDKPVKDAETLSAHPFQQRFTRIAVAALEQLDFEARGEEAASR